MYSIATIDYIIIAIYLMGMIGVGVWFAKKHTDFDDFFLAGRSLTTPLLITTLISTYYGIDVLFGDSQLGFTDGVVAWFGYGGHGLSIATYLGTEIGLLLTGQKDRSPFAEISHQTMFFYRDKPWFIPFASRYYQFLDWIS